MIAGDLGARLIFDALTISARHSLIDISFLSAAAWIRAKVDFRRSALKGSAALNWSRKALNSDASVFKRAASLKSLATRQAFMRDAPIGPCLSSLPRPA